MRKTVHLDPIGGLSGDMLLSGLLDAGAPVAAVQKAIDDVLPDQYRLETEEVHRLGLRALHLHFDRYQGIPERQNHSFTDMTARLNLAHLPARVKAVSQRILARLAEAEARVHGEPPEELQLGQLGEDDTLLDIVGISAALDALDVHELTVSSIPLAVGAPAGDTETRMPVPGPATLALLEGFEVHGGGAGETVTPTGAAALATVGRSFSRIPAMRLLGSGYGAGSRDPDSYPNVLRILYGETQASVKQQTRELIVIETNLDDLTPELVSDAVEAVRLAGALDVWTTATVMKKGRLGVVLSALCEDGRQEEVRSAFFESTSTLGVRSWPVSRTEMERSFIVVERLDGSVRVKVGTSGGRIISTKPEHDDVADLARKTNRPVRLVHAEVAALAREMLGTEPNARPETS